MAQSAGATVPLHGMLGMVTAYLVSAGIRETSNAADAVADVAKEVVGATLPGEEAALAADAAVDVAKKVLGAMLPEKEAAPAPGDHPLNIDGLSICSGHYVTLARYIRGTLQVSTTRTMGRAPRRQHRSITQQAPPQVIIL